jgi:GH24 family phage-related lysozyme (muramidase)
MGRIQVAALSASAVALVGLAVHEGYRENAYIPVKNDRATIGFGSTFKEDGTPVAMGDTTNPVQALQRTLKHIQKDEAGIKQCVTAPLYQHEYDLMVDFAYQYGVPTLCRSSIVKFANAGQYEKSCNSYLLYKYAGGFDCSTPGNRRCWGVWERQLKRQKKCLNTQ